MVHFLFASICFHYDYLKKQYRYRNRMLTSPIFTQVPEEVRKLAILKFSWNKTRDTPFLTGVPPHILMMSDMKRFEEILDCVSNDMVTIMKEELNRRDIGGDMQHAVQIQEQIAALSDDLAQIRAHLC